MPGPELPPDHISVTNVRPAYEASLRHGVDAARLESALGWRPEQIADDEASVDASSTYAHLELMFARPDYTGFILDAARSHGLSSLGVVGLACKTAATLGEALACHHRFQHLTNRTATYESSVTDGRLLITEARTGPRRPGRALVAEYAMLIAIHLMREVVGSLPVVRMCSPRPDWEESEARAIESFVGGPVEAGQPRASLEMDAEVLVRPLPSADPELERYFRGVLERSAPGRDEDSPLRQQLRRAIQQDLARGQASADAIASRLGLGRRTLQRRLAAEGTSFAELMEDTRRELAERYLADPSLSLSEIGYLLGYREQASFYRAFRRWHGTTPAGYRRSLASG